MNERNLEIFVTEVREQCKFALMAYTDLTKALQATESMDRIWYSVQAFLVAVGNVSKLLWSAGEIPERGSELRANLSIGDDSPIHPRTFRNHFEHFDERLDNWVKSSKHHNFIDSNVGALNMVSLPTESIDYLRNFDTTNFAVTFQGDTYDIQTVAASVRDLLVKANEMQQKLQNTSHVPPCKDKIQNRWPEFTKAPASKVFIDKVLLQVTKFGVMEQWCGRSLRRHY